MWTGPSPYFTAQREALARYVSAEAASSKDSWSRLTLRFPAPEEYVPHHLSAVPSAELVAAAGEKTRAAIVSHMKEATRAYVDGYGLAVPQEIHVATGYRAKP